MSLKDELGLNKSFATVGHEALLNIYFSSTCIKKRAGEFQTRSPSHAPERLYPLSHDRRDRHRLQ